MSEYHRRISAAQADILGDYAGSDKSRAAREKCIRGIAVTLEMQTLAHKWEARFSDMMDQAFEVATHRREGE